MPFRARTGQSSGCIQEDASALGIEPAQTLPEDPCHDKGDYVGTNEGTNDSGSHSSGALHMLDEYTLLLEGRGRIYVHGPHEYDGSHEEARVEQDRCAERVDNEYSQELEEDGLRARETFSEVRKRRLRGR